MKLTCQRDELIHGLQIVNGVVPSRTPKDILKNVKVQIGDGQTTLIGTDQEVGIRYQLIEVETDSAGELILPPQRVISILRELSNATVDLEVTDEAIWIRSGHSEFRLPIEDASEFPPVGEFEATGSVQIDPRVLQEMIRRTVFATDPESTRYALGGVLMDIQAESIILVATDSRRLAVASAACQCDGEVNSEGNPPVVPAKALSLIERSLGDETESVSLSIRSNDILVKCGRSTISSLLVEGRFPRYQDVIPQEFNANIELVVGPFHSAVRQAQITTSDSSRGVDFSFSAGLLKLTSQSAEYGESKIELPISYDGPEMTIQFDPRYVGDFLRTLEAEGSIRLELVDGENAAVFRVDDSYTYVIMPLSRDR